MKLRGPTSGRWEKLAVAILLILALLIGPRVLSGYFFGYHHRQASPKNSCINNLRQIDGAKEQWALENKHAVSAVGLSDPKAVDLYIKGGRPRCPSGGVYIYGKVDEPPTCSIAGHTLN